MGGTSTRVLERLNYFIDLTTNNIRRGELKALAHDIGSRPYTGVTFVFLGAVKIYGEDDDNELGEVDGLWATVNGGELRWRALEVKSGYKTSGVVKQLKKLRGFLCVNSTELQLTKIESGAKYSATDFGGDVGEEKSEG